ncbi:MAG: Rieske 2Fe-2S domain-containing protein [Pseudomonadota bacterium]
MLADKQARWMPAALVRDVLKGTVVPAALPSGPIAVWRSGTGALSANGDRCPHRGMRLSHGFVRGDTLSCIYHGWRFARDGTCQRIPAHPSVVPPKSINCGPLPVRESNGVVWVAAAPPDEEPSFYDGFAALRSLVFTASAAAIQKASQGVPVEGGLQLQLAGQPAYLLLSVRSTCEVFVVVLLDTDATSAGQVAASTAVETIRRRAEADESGLVPA